ncbi:phasin family protein [Bradyrhizobium sp. BWA-3-5]|uniref:phasin family protein n=1 Tax=Bradyrhizobium sp. BWA-3-5 TaxID=3080013 RepID=UPI003978959B
MSTTDDTKAAGKSGRRKGKGKKKPDARQNPAPVELQTPEPVEPQSPDLSLQPQPEQSVVESPPTDQAPLVAEPAEAVTAERVEAVRAAPEPEPAPAASAPSDAEPSSAERAPAASASAEPAPVSLQTIANAYRDYTRKSFEEFGSFVEQLSGARSLDKAMTVQTEFVKRAYETSVAESQKICELHTRLAKQTLDPFKRLAGKAPPTQGKR